MQVAVLLHCCWLFAIKFFAVRTPGSTFYHPMGVSSQILGSLWPGSQQPYAAYTAICCICSPCAAKCNPPAAKCTPPDVQYQPVCHPVANQTAPYAAFSAICCICSACAAKCNPQAAKYTPQASNISPEAALWPTSQQPYAAYTAICCIWILYGQTQPTGDQMHLPDV